jgi:hypothetical protein
MIIRPMSSAAERRHRVSLLGRALVACDAAVAPAYAGNMARAVVAVEQHTMQLGRCFWLRFCGALVTALIAAIVAKNDATNGAVLGSVRAHSRRFSLGLGQGTRADTEQ